MTNYGGSGNTQDEEPKEKRDLFLMVVLTFFNLGSGATTILGAMQILPRYLAWGIGGSVQLMLFILQAGFVANHAPLRKWVAILLLTGASVYTSFFTYYQELTQETNEKLALNRANSAHQELAENVLAPIEKRLNQLEQEADRLRRKAEAETERGIQSGFVGYGEVARQYDLEALNKESEADVFAENVKELRQKFDYDRTGLTPDDILQKDREALAAARALFRGDYELNRGDYIDEKLEISLMAPYLKVESGEQPAILSLVIALTVDGMAIMLGTAIVITSKPQGRRQSLFAAIALSIANFIREMKRLFFAFRQAVNESPEMFEDFDRAAAYGLSGPVEQVSLDLRGRGSDFLREFYGAIAEMEPHIINYSRIKDKYREDERIGIAFRGLIDKLREPKRGWVERNERNNNWQVKSDHYHQLVNWLEYEIRRLSKLERETESAIGDDDWLLSELKQVSVEVRIPYNQNSQN